MLANPQVPHLRLAFVLNGGPFPPPALPGFTGTTNPSASPRRPACPSRASGWSSLTTSWGLPCCVRFPCVHAVATTPAQRLAVLLRSFTPSRVSLPRKGCRVGLRIVLFEACSAFTRVTACTLALSPIRDTLSEGFSHFVTSIAAPAASGWSVAGWDLHPLESAALSRRTPRADIGWLEIPQRSTSRCDMVLALYDPHGRVTWQSTSNGESSFSHLAAQRRGRSRQEHSSQQCRRWASCTVDHPQSVRTSLQPSAKASKRPAMSRTRTWRLYIAGR